MQVYRRAIQKSARKWRSHYFKLDREIDHVAPFGPVKVAFPSAFS